jgi:hypothetical protein
MKFKDLSDKVKLLFVTLGSNPKSYINSLPWIDESQIPTSPGPDIPYEQCDLALHLLQISLLNKTSNPKSVNPYRILKNHFNLLKTYRPANYSVEQRLNHSY